MKCLLTTLLIVSLTVTTPVSSNDLPTFRMAARDSTASILLVPANTSDSDVVKLITALRSARSANTLGQFLPPTTPNGSKGAYGIVAVFIMSDPTWATSARLKAFMRPTSSGISASEKEFGKRVRGYYSFAALMNQEFGTLGYEDEGHRYTTTYRKLF